MILTSAGRNGRTVDERPRMKLTTMETLEAEAAELKRSKLLTIAQRDDALLANAFSRSMLEVLDVKSIEEAEDVIRHLHARAAETDRLERESAQIKAEIAATRLEQEKKNATNK
jgi:hypothetical protein